MRCMTPLTETQRQMVEDNYKLVYAGVNNYRRSDIDRELMTAEFGYALCQAVRTYNSSRGSLSAWAFWYFKNAFMVLLRDRYRRGISGDCSTIRTETIPPQKRRHNESETSIETLQEDGRLYSLRSTYGSREQELDEMREDFGVLKGKLSPVQQDILASRMRGESFTSIGKRYGFSKQRACDLQREAIKTMGE